MILPRVLPLCLLATTARAQVNVEPLRQQVEHDGIGARLRISITSYAGNTEGVIFGSSGLIGGRSGNHFGYVNGSADYTRLNGTVNVAKSFAHGRHNYELGSWFWWEEFGQVENDRFRRVRLRALLGTGPRVGVLQAEGVEVYLGTGYMYEHTEFISAEDGRRGEGFAHRASNYVAATYRPDERILMSSVNYWQPRLDAFSDYHLLSVSSVEFKITERLQSRLDGTLRYETVTPDDVGPLDFELKSSLELVF